MNYVILNKKNTTKNKNIITYKPPNSNDINGKLIGMRAIKMTNFNSNSQFIQITNSLICNNLANPSNLFYAELSDNTNYFNKEFNEIIFYKVHDNQSEWSLRFFNQDFYPIDFTYDEILIEFVIKDLNFNKLK